MNKTYDTKLTLDADGKPTAVASAIEVNMISGGFTDLVNRATLSKDKVVVGPGATVGSIAAAYIGGAATRMRLGLPFQANVWASQ